ncbi:unnamed protein product [Microthlaspi erraticum]|uniref:Uncharacterized protein n=1 Tax=Microthlaspi erraticum TaxID=1685480 RepID=A0A6D2IX92_9BRAS|nr:unnamed protein product [Microthlaspi erraticum]
MEVLGTLIRFNEFGVDGGPADKELAPKIDLAKAHLSSRLGVALPSVRPVVVTIIALKGAGGLLFVIGNIFGAYLLAFYLVDVSPILYDFYNYGPEERHFSPLLTEFLQEVVRFLKKDEGVGPSPTQRTHPGRSEPKT